MNFKPFEPEEAIIIDLTGQVVNLLAMLKHCLAVVNPLNFATELTQAGYTTTRLKLTLTSIKAECRDLKERCASVGQRGATI